MTQLRPTRRCSTGTIDSVNFSTLISILEKKYGKQIDLMDVGYDNFDTPRQMFEILTHDDGNI